MRVRLGWSGEIESNVWRKADVELDESDLYRLLAESEIINGDSGSDAWLIAQISTRVAFQLLQAEAEILLMRKLMTLGYPTEKASDRIIRLETENDHVLTRLREKYTKVVMA